MTIKYLKNAKNLSELRKLYIQAMKENHPDNGGSEEACKAINAEYDFLSGKLPKDGAAAESQEGPEKASASAIKDEDLKNIVSGLAGFDGLNIEIVGSWVWVDGNTYPARDALKNLGFQWSKSRKKWHWCKESRRCRGVKWSFDRIRAEHGSMIIENEKRVAIA